MVYFLMFAISAPAGYAGRFLTEKLKEIDRDFCCTLLTICTHSRRERHLMEAIRWQLGRSKDLANCSEAVVERQENAFGGASWEVELQPLRNVVSLGLQRGGRKERVCLVMERGDEGGLPRRAELCIRSVSHLSFLYAAWHQNAAACVIEAQDSSRDFLHRWLQHIYAEYMRTSTGVVEVYELTKDSADAPLVWTRVRQERSVTASGTGMWHYAAGEWAIALKNRAEYAIRHRGKTRVNLFVSGAKGSGKTLFVEWLAGELGLPLYNVDLTSPHVNNDSLRDVMTPNKLVHNLPVIFHVDEFQALIGEWAADQVTSGPVGASSPKRTLVTIQGLQNMLEGTSTPNNAIFVFTSSQPLPETEDHEWKGLLRRFPVQVKVPLMCAAQRMDYCRHYLSAYLSQTQPWDPSCKREVIRWNAFEAVWA
jgi:hypothetical protein